MWNLYHCTELVTIPPINSVASPRTVSVKSIIVYYNIDIAMILPGVSSYVQVVPTNVTVGCG